MFDLNPESDSTDEEVCESEQNATLRCEIQSRTTFHSKCHNF